MAEHPLCTREVVGPNPIQSTKYLCPRSSAEERFPPEEEAAGSNPAGDALLGAKQLLVLRQDLKAGAMRHEQLASVAARRGRDLGGGSRREL